MTIFTKLVTIPLGFGLLLLGGCSSEEASQETKQATKQIEKKVEQAAGTVKEKTGELSDEVKTETPKVMQNMKDSYKEGEQKIEENVLQKGDKAIANKDGYLAITPEAYDELYQLIEVNDFKGVENIEKDNQVIEITKSTEVEIIERDVIRTKVKTLESNKEGYLPTSLLEPVNNNAK
ncbi:hypothetical protein D0469_03700 [Peribacillus saganii]|uniref:Lipoprotein n=1 Tax=Peribacillus saganii TaxID=2303992 RepID=A0A372LS99_9BACI|nr:hypothetical protein [Peribacillus saganii]RFU71053.1 hypothetical protein D0469_03700 [Peribacillus saganii]